MSWCISAVKKAVLMMCLVSCAVFAHAESKPVAPESITGVRIITAEQVIEMLLANPDIAIIDSRKNTEYLKGHIEGAVNLLNTEMTQADIAKIVRGKNQPVIFYCNGERCLRSSDAASKAVSWGYTNLYWFRGGWKEWTDKRLPVATDDKK